MWEMWEEKGMKKTVEIEACADHNDGCYIRLRKGKIKDSIEHTVIIDFNEKNEVIGIDLQESFRI